jgi:hypothetical protein
MVGSGLGPGCFNRNRNCGNRNSNRGNGNSCRGNCNCNRECGGARWRIVVVA